MKNIKKKNKYDKNRNQVTDPPIVKIAPHSGINTGNTDPLGSYTGRPLDGGTPTQDADDL